MRGRLYATSSQAPLSKSISSKPSTKLTFVYIVYCVPPKCCSDRLILKSIVSVLKIGKNLQLTNDIVPTQITAFDFLFHSLTTLKTFSASPSQAKGSTNAATKARITFEELETLSTHISTSLQLHGFKEGEVVSICSPNSLFFPIALFGVMRAGGIAALSSPVYGVEEMIHVIRTVGSRFVMCSASALEVVSKAARVLGISNEFIIVLDEKVERFKA